jgi:hypothetical protein
VHIEKHDPFKISVSNPLALSAQEHAFIEETMAKGRDAQKRKRANSFYQSTRMMLLKKMQDIEHNKVRENFETAEKIKKLLSDTIEFSQKTALAAKKAMQGSQESEMDEDLSLNEDKSSRSGTGKHPVIRNLVGATPHDKKLSLSSPDHHRG